jgi:ABC-type multidrug transport system ATPase subunit
MDAISVEDLTKKYGDKQVLKGVNLKIEEGGFYALMGPNGSGKTTLASIIASIRFPTSGKIEIYGKKPEDAKRFDWIYSSGELLISNSYRQRESNVLRWALRLLKKRGGENSQ